MIAARALIAQVLGCEPGRIRPIGRGNDTERVAVTFADGRTLVAKVGHAGSRLDLEVLMLRYLAPYSTLPVPEVSLESHPDHDPASAGMVAPSDRLARLDECAGIRYTQ